MDDGVSRGDTGSVRYLRFQLKTFFPIFSVQSIYLKGGARRALFPQDFQRQQGFGSVRPWRNDQLEDPFSSEDNRGKIIKNRDNCLIFLSREINPDLDNGFNHLLVSSGGCCMDIGRVLTRCLVLVKPTSF